MRTFLAVLLAALLVGCAAAEPSARPSSLKVLVVRLAPGDDPKAALDKLVRDQGIEAAFVLGCAGSLTRAVIRFADKREPTTLEEKLEIVSLGGTLSASGGSHLHISVANGEGRTFGGHLKGGSAVYTTAEIAIGVAEDLRFTRAQDSSGYPELSVERR
ncbi:MAG TPA: PPC domain-containing DNA-binding protein [Planctomycetota bacterium]|nr:PPC domain-containing DNA-binding protein [Planctomycetota bacterium]